MRTAFLVISVLVLVSGMGSSLADGTGVPWAVPPAMALRRVGDVSTIRHEPDFLNSLDCELLSYRLRDSQQMQTGCFTHTALGLLDSDMGIMIFNGTDEGQQLLPYGPHQGVEPWPDSGGLLTLTPTAIDGSYLGLYRNPLAAMKDQFILSSPLSVKQFIRAPDLTIRDPGGQLLVINPQTLAVSDGGNWLAVETLGGSFVRINLATLEILPFALAFGSQGSPALLHSYLSITSDGRYVAIANKDSGSLKVYDLDNCRPAPPPRPLDLPPLNCSNYDYQPFINPLIPGLQSIRHVRFISDGLLSFEAHTNSSDLGVYELAPQGSIRFLTDYLGLGDSFTSGEGAYDYLAGTDSGDNVCHLSVHSYPLLLARDEFGQTGGHSVACSGAVINDVSSRSPAYRGQARGAGPPLADILAGYRPGYIAQHRFVQQFQPRIVSVSVGGNDIGFGSILEACVTPHLSAKPRRNSCYDTYEDRVEVTNLIDRTVSRWTGLFKQLQAEDPGSQLLVIGYPQIVYPQGSCGFNVHLDSSELRFTADLTDYINTAIRQAAASAGVQYVDISQALAGHRLCEAASQDIAVNGLTAGTDAGFLGLKVFGHESYHPNALGQYLIEQSILRQADFKSDIPPLFPPTIAKQSLAILAVPKSGRPIYSLTPNATLTAPGAKPGSKLTIAVNGVRDGLMPNTAYDIHWDGPSRLMLGSVTSDGQADLDAAVSIPADADGEHRIDVVGPNQAGETADITQQIYISTEPNIPQAGELPARIMPDQNTNIRNGVGERAIRHRQAARPPLNTNINLAGKTIRKSEPKPYIFNWLWLLAALIGLWLGLVLATLIKRLLQ